MVYYGLICQADHDQGGDRACLKLTFGKVPYYTPQKVQQDERTNRLPKNIVHAVINQVYSEMRYRKLTD
jgi:hypothetical protein